MVRAFPAALYRHYSVNQDDGSQHIAHSSNFHVTGATRGSSPPGFNRFISRFVFLCRRTHGAHPLGIFYGENPLDFSFSLILFEITLVILFSRIIRFILKPLRQPRVVSDIIGGIMVGPTVLGRSRRFAKHIFPDNSLFVIKNIGVIGFMYFLFVSGVKIDLSLLTKLGRKHVYTAILGVVLPFVAAGALGYILRPNMGRHMAKISSIGGIATNLSLTALPVIYLVLKELNLLSSEIGRMAISTAIVSDAIGILAVVVFEAAKQGEYYSRNVVWYLISVLILGAFTLTAVRRAMIWIIDKTPEGKPVNQTCVVFILTGVMAMGFLTDMFGIAIAVGSLWLGLVMPDGPPLGAALVERSETITMEILMPFSFAMVGLYTDVSALAGFDWSKVVPFVAMNLAGYVSKIAATFVSALYFKIPLKDSLALGLIMNLRGQFDLLIGIHLIDKDVIRQQFFTALVLLITSITAISTPLISILYDPTRPYMVNKRRTIQHTAPESELRIVICIHEEGSVAGIINLLEVSHPSVYNPFSVYALHLIELVGRANPDFIDHEQEDIPNKYDTDNEAILNALKLYQETREDFVELHFFTAVTATRTMYQDICKLALEQKAAIIIVPFGEGSLDNVAGTEIVRHGHGMQSTSAKVLSNAPCSVGILVDKGHVRHAAGVGQSFRHSAHKFVMLFMGGADAREALAYADRMAMNSEVFITVIRFLSYDNEGDDEKEKKLDDGVVTWFWVKNETNERVIYREVVVKNGEETLTAIRAFNNEENELWIVGRKQGINPVLLQGLGKWSENLELGVIGDIVASADFGSSASVLVIQQQILRDQGREGGGGAARGVVSSQGRYNLSSISKCWR